MFLKKYLDLRLAFFLLKQFFFDLRSFWILMFTWTKMRICVLTGRYLLTFFSRIFFAYFPGKDAHNLASKSMKCENAKSGAIVLMWRKTAQKAEISQTIIYVCLFEDTGIDVKRASDLFWLHTTYFWLTWTWTIVYICVNRVLTQQVHFCPVVYVCVFVFCAFSWFVV